MTADKPITSLTLNLSRAELRFLMQALGASTVTGLEAASDDPAMNTPDRAQATLAEGRRSLLERDLVRAPRQGKLDRLNPVLFNFLPAVFEPQAVLMVLRNIAGFGKQVLIFNRQGKHLVLHSFPQAGSHRLECFQSPRQAYDMLMSWFPFDKYPSADVRMRMPAERFETLRELAQAGQIDAARLLLDHVQVSTGDKLNLVNSLQRQGFSGSFALTRVRADRVISAASLALFADPELAWVVGQPEDASQDVVVRRVGADFGDLVAAWLEAWAVDASVEAAEPAEKQAVPRRPASPEKLT